MCAPESPIMPARKEIRLSALRCELDPRDGHEIIQRFRRQIGP